MKDFRIDLPSTHSDHSVRCLPRSTRLLPAHQTPSATTAQFYSKRAIHDSNETPPKRDELLHVTAVTATKVPSGMAEAAPEAPVSATSEGIFAAVIAVTWQKRVSFLYC